MDLPTSEYEAEIIGCPLPRRRVKRQNCQYGVKLVAARYCGFPDMPFGYPGEWQHGWHPPEHNLHPELVVGGDGLSRQSRTLRHFWVSRQDQADFLHDHGYTKVTAIGLPIIYVPKPSVERLKNSLLVMPAHSLPDTEHEWDFDAYADYIAEIAPRFSRVVVCVHPSCFARGYWVHAFRERGIAVISGADIFDQNSLYRMAELFSRFDFLTSNSSGSHLVYGAFFNCKPSISGPVPTRRMDDFRNSLIYRNAPDLLPLVFSINSMDSLRAAFPHLFCEPWSAIDCRPWAEWQIGKQCQKRPDELRRHFRWTFTRLAYQCAASVWRPLKRAVRRRFPKFGIPTSSARSLAPSHTGSDKQEKR